MHSLSFDLHVELHGAQSKHRTLCHSHYQNSIIYVPLLYVVSLLTLFTVDAHQAPEGPSGQQAVTISWYYCTKVCC